MPRYKIIVAYDGTDFFGWQQQKEKPSIVDTLQKVFKQVFNHEISILGASRTDAGVHALGQVACFNTELIIEPSIMQEAWNKILPSSIVVRSLERVSDTYNPHNQVLEKTYHYYFFLERPLPFSARYGWHYYYAVDLEKLHRCLQVFVGTHDFRSFSTGDDRGDDTIRTITSAHVEKVDDHGYRIIIKGPKFLRHMIRRIVGACLHAASRDTLETTDLEIALQQRHPEQELPNAPARGLILVHIDYDQTLEIRKA